MITLNFTPFPVIETERLVLRNLKTTDRQRLFEIRSNETTMQYIPRPRAKKLEDVDALIEMIVGFTNSNERINWVVTEKGSDTLLGMFGYVNFKPECYRGEIGYVMHPDAHGKGFAAEALKPLLEYGFETIGLHSIEAIIRPENIRSKNLAEKMGFVKEAYFKDYIFFEGSFYDEEVYSLINPNG